MLRMHPDYEHRNRAYVIDNAGNKLFYGTIYACQRFIVFIERGEKREQAGKACGSLELVHDKG